MTQAFAHRAKTSPAHLHSHMYMCGPKNSFSPFQLPPFAQIPLEHQQGWKKAFRYGFRAETISHLPPPLMAGEAQLKPCPKVAERMDHQKEGSTYQGLGGYQGTPTDRQIHLGPEQVF